MSTFGRVQLEIYHLDLCMLWLLTADLYSSFVKFDKGFSISPGLPKFRFVTMFFNSNCIFNFILSFIECLITRSVLL